jgi:hypothetical protein
MNKRENELGERKSKKEGECLGRIARGKRQRQADR